MEAVLARDAAAGTRLPCDHIAATTQTLSASATEWEQAGTLA
jgi:hypothetical protein